MLYSELISSVILLTYDFQESLNVKAETTEYLETLEKDLLEQIEGLGGNQLFTKIVGLLSPSRIQTD